MIKTFHRRENSSCSKTFQISKSRISKRGRHRIQKIPMHLVQLLSQQRNMILSKSKKKFGKSWSLLFQEQIIGHNNVLYRIPMTKLILPICLSLNQSKACLLSQVIKIWHQVSLSTQLSCVFCTQLTSTNFFLIKLSQEQILNRENNSQLFWISLPLSRTLISLSNYESNNYL